MAGASTTGLEGNIFDSAVSFDRTFTRTTITSNAEDFLELKRAALEEAYAPKLAARKAVLVPVAESFKLVELNKLSKEDKDMFLDMYYPNSSSPEILTKIKDRYDRAGVPYNDVEVRWSNLTLTGKVALGSAGIPTLYSDLKAKAKKLLGPLGGSGQQLKDMKIMDGVSGVLKSGRFTLLLGPPGSGKSKLMQALAGQLRSEKGIKVEYDELSYNGLRLDEITVERSAAYISQIDTHHAELTCRETLDFSARCQGMEKRIAMLKSLEEAEKVKGITPDPDVVAVQAAMCTIGKENFVTDVMIKLLGLGVCADTVVGNAMLRGISGGQKKRVTTGEMIVGPMSVIFADEISTGLDSATTFDICNSLRMLCHTMQFTMLIALLQPTPETYDLFDDIMVLSSGKIVYHGPREQVLPFFASIGFECPERKGIADFLQEVTSPCDQKQFWSLPEPHRQINSHQISEAFYKTQHGQAMLGELAKPLDPSTKNKLSAERYGRPAGFLFKANLRITWTLQKRNLNFYMIRIIQTIFMSFVVGTLFLQQGKSTMNDAQLFMGAGFFSIMFMMTGAFPEGGMLVMRLPVFYKQRDAHFYPAWCYALPRVLLRVPWSFVESWIWTLMTYFMVGFSTGPRLFAYWGILFVSSVFTNSLFMAVGALCRTQAVTSAIQSFMFLVFVSTSGFTLTSTNIRNGWKGAFWANPMAYFVRALLINELTSPDWDTPGPDGMPLGEAALVARGFSTEYKFVWIALFAWGVGCFFTNTAILIAAFQWLSDRKGTTIVSEEFLAERAGARPTIPCKCDFSAPAKGSPVAGSAADFDLEKGDGMPTKAQKGFSLSFKPLCLTFKDMRYSVPIPKENTDAPVYTNEGPHAGQLMLLKGITGSFRPGVLTALMGASGAGKTTLMDVLAGRKTGGTITGNILLNGFEKEPRTFARIMGYVEQTDVHIPEATVHEALTFSAQLRLPSNTPDEARKAFVEEVMSLVELTEIKDSPVGLPGQSGLSVEQRKRLTIAVELVANPSIVFMDEPTSGLDARAAAIVMRAVRNTVNTGRTVVCTIHQPSLEIFEAFDELLLLKRGGETIFHGAIGKDAAHLVAYFAAIPGVPVIQPRANPASWMLEVSSPAAETTMAVNFAELYRNSELAKSCTALVDSLATPPEGDSPLRFEDMHVATAPRQLRFLLGRALQQYSRNISYNGTRLLISLVIGICFGTLYRDLGGDTSSYNGVMNIAGALYSSVLFLGILDCMMVQDVICTRRGVYYREHAAGMYSSIPYSLAELLVEVPYLVAQSCIYSLLVYWMIGFEADAGKFFYFLAIMILTLGYWTCFGVQNVHLTPALQLSNTMSSMFFGLFNLFCGFLRPEPTIPKGWIWAYYVNPVSWTLYGLIVGQLGDMQDKTIVNVAGEVQTLPEFLESYFGFKYSMKGWCALILAAYIFFFSFTSILALRKLNFQKR